MDAKPLRHVDLYGSAGRLEALYRDLQDPAAIAVICHPHPLGGGTLHNKVVFRASRGLEQANVATLRFNFRGVGTSSGRHDEGEGEQDDVLAAIEWARRKHPGLRLIVGGFSFGAWVSSRVACDIADVTALFFIGTPVNRYDFSHLRGCEKPILFVHGTQDEFGDVEKVESLVPIVRKAESVVITGADHFFTRHLEPLQETMRTWGEDILGT